MLWITDAMMSGYVHSIEKIFSCQFFHFFSLLSPGGAATSVSGATEERGSSDKNFRLPGIEYLLHRFPIDYTYITYICYAYQETTP